MYSLGGPVLADIGTYLGFIVSPGGVVAGTKAEAGDGPVVVV